ncbi:nuclear transport factor 2 family protein [Geothrix campi]|uniref:nuclear transport factor 2 family protein n=1 Tax=Geothrix campi TaxID=2966450 RepID=UPI002148B213|nr:nuclear transport factor 2 family protein [Geothrix sp. SG10]
MHHESLAPAHIEILGPADRVSQATKETIRRFHQAFDDHDPQAMEALVADDCVIETIKPAPGGARAIGKAACLEIWQGLASAAGTWFEREEVLVAGERVVIRWRYRWGGDAAQSIRGLNLMRVREGLIVEAMGYVKA